MRSGGVLLVALAAAVAVMAIPAAASAATTSPGLIPVKVVFAGSGTFTIDETYLSTGGDCTVTTHDVMPLNWQTTYTTVLDHGVMAGTLGALDGQLGTLSFSAQSFGREGCDQVAPLGWPSCSAALSGTGRAPSLSASSNGSADVPAKITAESATGVAPPGCNVGAQRDATVLGSILPGALTAVGTLPAHVLDQGASYTMPVSSAQASPQAPSDCTGSGRPATGTIACSSSLTWSGTVTFTPVCRKVGDTGAAADLPDCIDRQRKDDAQAAANQYAQEEPLDGLNYKVNCTGWAGKLTKRQPGGVWFCAGLSAKWIGDTVAKGHYQQIANDPPDSDYTQVAAPRTPRVKGLNALHRALPASYRLFKRYLQIVGLTGAVMTAQNRSTGAFLAFIAGNQAAGGYVATQANAALQFANQAAALLSGQHRLAVKARAELRRLAARLHGRGSQHLASEIRRLASSLLSKRAQTADQLAVAALSGLGQ